MQQNLFEQNLLSIDKDLHSQQIDQYYRFLAEVDRYGSALGLTEAKGDQLIIDHLFDSLAAIPHLKPYLKNSLCDVGSGAGFPGIALAIALPHIQVDLVERMQKRARFLEMLSLKLKLKNVRIFNQDIKSIKSSYDLVLFRALTQIDPKWVAQLLELAPRLFAYKGRASVVQEESLMLQSVGMETEMIKLEPPLSSKERHLLHIFYHLDKSRS